MSDIRIDESKKLYGKTFRVALFNGCSCRYSLWCRIDWHNDDWRLSFFDSFRGADHDWRPLQSLNSRQMELATKAIEHAKQWLVEDDDDSQTPSDTRTEVGEGELLVSGVSDKTKPDFLKLAAEKIVESAKSPGRAEQYTEAAIRHALPLAESYLSRE